MPSLNAPCWNATCGSQAPASCPPLALQTVALTPGAEAGSGSRQSHETPVAATAEAIGEATPKLGAQGPQVNLSGAVVGQPFSKLRRSLFINYQYSVTITITIYYN